MDLFCFYTTGACKLDSYTQLPALGREPVYALSTRGPRRLVALSGLSSRTQDWMGIRTYSDVCKQHFSLEEDSPENPLMVGEALLEDVLTREFSLTLSPMLVHIRLRSVSADFGAYSYAGSPFFNKLLYLGFAVCECLPLGSANGPRPVSWLNAGDVDSVDVRRLPHPQMLLQEGVGAIGPERVFPERDFYCYPGEDTRLVLTGTVGKDTCYYAVPLPGLKPGKSYELQLTLLRKGASSPDLPTASAAVMAQLNTAPWIREETQYF